MDLPAFDVQDIMTAAVMLSDDRGQLYRPRGGHLRAGYAGALLDDPLALRRCNILRTELVFRHELAGLEQRGSGLRLIRTGRQSEQTGDLFCDFSRHRLLFLSKFNKFVTVPCTGRP